MDNQTKHCKNCDHLVQGKYCSNCGQETNSHRINGHLIVHGIIHGIFHFDKGFLYTFRELNTRPGHSIREFINGKRVKHGNPIFTLLILSGLLSYVYYHYAIKTMSSLSISELDEYSEMLHFLTSKYFSLTYAGFCFVFAFIDYQIFKMEKYNYTEYFVLNIFIAIEVILINLIISPVLYYFKGSGINPIIRLLILIVIIIYFFIVRYQFFEIKKDKRKLNKLLLVIAIDMVVLASFGFKTIYALITN